MKKIFLFLALLSTSLFSQVSRTQILTDIDAGIYSNTTHQITAPVLNAILKELANSDVNIISNNFTAIHNTTIVAGTGVTVTKAPSTQTYTISALPYKKYVALLTQSSTSDPSVVILENTIGTIVWARSDVGQYVASKVSAFTANKTAVFIGNYSFMTAAQWLDETNIQVNTFSNLGVAADGLLTVTPIEIRIYP